MILGSSNCYLCRFRNIGCTRKRTLSEKAGRKKREGERERKGGGGKSPAFFVEAARPKPAGIACFSVVRRSPFQLREIACDFISTAIFLMSSMLSVTRNSKSARIDTGARGIVFDGIGRRRRRPRRRRPLPRPPLAAASLASSNEDDATIPLGAQCGVRVPRLILGTMQFGEALSPKESHEIMDAAAGESGEASQKLLGLDTAEAYPVPMAASTRGSSERIVGDWLRATPPGKIGRRERTVLITKVSGPGDQPWIRGGPPRLDGEHLLEALEGSLRRLRVEEVDLLLLHWPDRYVPMFGEVEFDPSRSFFKCRKNGNDDGGEDDDGLAETERHFEDVLSAAFDAVTAGKLRAIGLSNETPTGLLAAASASRRRRRREEKSSGDGASRRRQIERKLPLFPGVAAVSNAYSLLARNFDSNGMAEACEATRVPLLGYGPLVAGLLSGKYEGGDGGEGGGGGEKNGDGDSSFGGPPLARLNRYRHEYAEEGRRYARTPRVREAVRSYVEIARRHGLRGGGPELALRFALSRPAPCGRAAVFGATSAGDVRAALAAAARGGLPAEILEECDAVHARNPNPAP